LQLIICKRIIRVSLDTDYRKNHSIFTGLWIRDLSQLRTSLQGLDAIPCLKSADNEVWQRRCG
jgi:hypothetical protein